ncbi:hypothetical protein HDV00_008256 [Rhizophlyctis rosea]|nr:hypothetical protein HDV00_008256 [Rhizophlyctis rosea]
MGAADVAHLSVEVTGVCFTVLLAGLGVDVAGLNDDNGGLKNVSQDEFESLDITKETLDGTVGVGDEDDVPAVSVDVLRALAPKGFRPALGVVCTGCVDDCTTGDIFKAGRFDFGGFRLETVTDMEGNRGAIKALGTQDQEVAQC